MRETQAAAADLHWNWGISTRKGWTSSIRVKTKPFVIVSQAQSKTPHFLHYLKPPGKCETPSWAFRWNVVSCLRVDVIIRACFLCNLILFFFSLCVFKQPAGTERDLQNERYQASVLRLLLQSRARRRCRCGGEEECKLFRRNERSDRGEEPGQLRRKHATCDSVARERLYF